MGRPNAGDHSIRDCVRMTVVERVDAVQSEQDVKKAVQSEPMAKRGFCGEKVLLLVFVKN